MNHPTEDDLLRHALEAYESDSERTKTTTHLQECTDCRARLAGIRSDIGVIAGVRPRRRILQLPTPRQAHLSVYALVRSAALVILGVALGYGLSSQNRREPVQVSSAYVTLAPPADSLRRYAAADATEVPAPYGTAVLGDGR
jgi:hypothetical protein